MKADAPYVEMIALAHAVDPALHELQVIARNPIQGEAMHKVIGYYAHDALEQIGWYDGVGFFDLTHDGENCQRVYVIRDPGSYTP